MPLPCRHTNTHTTHTHTHTETHKTYIPDIQHTDNTHPSQDKESNLPRVNICPLFQVPNYEHTHTHIQEHTHRDTHTRDTGSILGSGRSLGVGYGNPL